LSKAELAKRTGLSVATITRIENGQKCRVSTKRRILVALDLEPKDVRLIFEDEKGLR